MGRHRRPETDFRVLFVCTGNVCRSPFAELLTRHLLDDRLDPAGAAGFHVESAGLLAVTGGPMHPASRRELRPWGLDGVAAARFVSRSLTPAQVEGSELVLAMSPRHRAGILQATPHALGTTFTLREFARLASSVDRSDLPLTPIPRAHALVEAARLRRGLVLPVEPHEDSIPDPVGQPQVVHHLAADLIRSAVETIVDAITLPVPLRSQPGSGTAGRLSH